MLNQPGVTAIRMKGSRNGSSVPRVEGKVASDSRSSAVKELSANSIVSARAR